VLQPRITDGLTGILPILAWGTITLLLLTCVASAQSVDTIDSETHLASILCRAPTQEAVNEKLLNTNAQLVNATLWSALLDCASSAQSQGSPARPIEIYKLTLRVADRLNKPELVATTYYYLGRTYSRMNAVENSIQAYETSRKLFEQAGIESSLIYVVADLSAMYFTAEDYEEAQRYAEQGLAIAGQVTSSPIKGPLGPVEYGQARSLHTLGEIDLHHGDHEEAKKKLSKAVALYEGLNGAGSSYNIQMAEALIGLAKVYAEMGEYRRAFSYLNKARQVARSSGDLNTQANVMRNQAVLFLEQEDYATAQKYFDASLAIYRSLVNAREETRVILSLAGIEERQGRHDDALCLFQRSMERAQLTNSVDMQIAAGQGLAVVLTAKRDFPNALQAINGSLKMARRVNARTSEVELLWRAAQIHYAIRDYRESAALAEQALTLARSLRLPKLAYLSAATLGEAYAADDKVDLAIAALKDAIDQVEELRDHAAGRREARQFFFENKVGPYHTLVKLLTRQSKNFEALLYAERAKGRLLVEAVRNDARDLQNVLTPTEKDELIRLHDKILAVYQRMQSMSDHDATGELNKQLDTARREFASFEKTLVAAHPELLLRTNPAQPLTGASLNGLVRADNLAYLEYVVSGNNIGLFILRRNEVTAHHELKYVNLSVNTDELRRKVNEFHSALAKRDPGFIPLGRELYDLLIAPVANELENIRTVCIIPDDYLWTLPFQALTTTRGNYLIQEHSLYYAPSLSVLNEMALRGQQQSSSESLIAFGNPVIERDEKLRHDLHPLPQAEAEAAAVAAAVQTRMKRVLVGSQADEKTFKSLAPQFATIHLATHGLLDNTDPLNSYLLLTKTEGAVENDGFLHAREIINLRLNADLVVLSACETGKGRISPGEGVVGMAWAFFVAGARSMVVSQWRVNSASTSQLMKNFYQALGRQHNPNSRDKSEALREASLRLLNDRRYRHPFYWAGFVLVSTN